MQTHATVWMNFEIIILSEEKPVMQDYILYDSINRKEVFRIGKSIETESRFVVACWGEVGRWRGGRGE